MNRDLTEALTRGWDVGRQAKARAESYRKPGLDHGSVKVRATVSGRFTQIEVRAADRIGLLADIAEALFSQGLDVHLARIDTMGGEARDTFLTRRTGGVAVRDPAELIALSRRIEDRLRG